MAEPLWRVELLGDLRVVGNGKIITRFESRRAAALLAYLALYPQRRISREELIDRIWPDATLEAGRNRLKQALSSLRRQLEPPPLPSGSVFEADRFSIGLRPGAITTDVNELPNTLKHPHSTPEKHLWRGELLTGFYDDWIQQERERLNGLYQNIGSSKQRVDSAKQSLIAEPLGEEPEQGMNPVLLTDTGIIGSNQASRQCLLPVQVTRFFGREPELTRLQELLSQERWISITGPGGMGKTRLAIELAQRQTHGDVWFVPLVELTTTAQLGVAVAGALKLMLRPQTDDFEQVLNFLGESPALLVLDNAEQLVDDQLAEPLTQLLRRCPQVHLLVTSRQPLGGEGERIISLGPLPLPASESPVELALLPSIQLFLDRAQRARVDVGLTTHNAGTLAALCRHLDGIPLAIELVASWAQALSPTQILAQLLAGNQALTTSRRHDVPERHRSLHSVFLGSYQRLSHEAQYFFTQLSIFRGGGTLEAARAICNTSNAWLLLTELTEASLVQVQETEQGELRFSLLESLRQFAMEYLESAEYPALRERHSAYYAALAESAVRLEPERDQASWLDTLQTEWDNLRAALRNAPVARALRLPVALYDFLTLRGHVREGMELLETALKLEGGDEGLRLEARAVLGALTPEVHGILAAQEILEAVLTEVRLRQLPACEAFVLYHLGRLAFLRHALTESWEWHRQSRALRQKLEEPGALALSEYALAQLALRMPEPPEPVWELLRRAQTLARQARQQNTLADILYESAWALTNEGDYDAAYALLIDCQSQAVRLGSVRLEAKIANQLGELRRSRGDFKQAMEHYRVSALLFAQLRDSGAAHFPLWNLGCCFEEFTDWERALLLIACAVKLWEEVGRPFDEESRGLIAQYRQKVVDIFGELRTETIYQRGYSLSITEAIALTEK